MSLMRSVTALACAAFAIASVPLEACLAPGDEIGAFVAFGSAVSFCIRDIAPDAAYELKVSYPSSLPARFSLSLVEGGPFRSAPPGHRNAVDATAQQRSYDSTARRLLSESPVSDESAAESEESEREDSASLAGGGVRIPGRRLLDTEKLVFSTSAGAASGGGGGSVLVLHPDLPPAGAPVSAVLLRVEAAPGSPGVLLPPHAPTGVAFRLKLDPLYGPGRVIPGTALPLIPAMAAVVVLVALGVWALRTSPLSPFNWLPPEAGRAALAAAVGATAADKAH